jgi:hypothetical protein
MEHGRGKLELAARFFPISSLLVSTPFAGKLKARMDRAAGLEVDGSPCALWPHTTYPESVKTNLQLKENLS